MKGVAIKKGEEKKSNYFPIVAIGASAGGLEALIELLKNLPLTTGMSYIYIPHLSPDHESNLADILGRITKMPVQEARDGIKLQSDHLYIIPPNRSMVLSS